MATIRSRVLSGIQPTGRLHIGNYLGALKNFVALQADHDCLFMVADLHALTENYEAKEKTSEIVDIIASYLAAGLDPKKCTLFLQSYVPAHTELAWVLNTVTPMGELERMTQYKDKSARQPGNANVGLFTYPTLMAADILLYNGNLVPVGDDQTQHLELTRTVAKKFNARYGSVLTMPMPLYTSVPRLMSLTDPNRKMSKSEPAGCLFLDDEPIIIKKKIARAVTDSGALDKGEVAAGVANLFLLLDAFSAPKVAADFRAKQQAGTIRYSELKETLATDICAGLKDFQKKFLQLRSRPRAMLTTLRNGSKEAEKIANQTMKKVRQAIGLPSHR